LPVQEPVNRERLERMAGADQDAAASVSKPLAELPDGVEAKFSGALQNFIIGWMPDRARRARVETLLVGLHVSM